MDLSKLEHPSLDSNSYETQLKALQHELMLYQQMIFMENKKVVIAIEGTDTAGKGGLIKRLVGKMDPRGFDIHCIGAPFGKELQEHYLQRFWRRIPRSGDISIFDRTWYGRVLVEKIELNLSEKLLKAAWKDIQAFEEQLANDDIILIKLFLSITKDEQKKRLLQRLETPEKNWKLSESDFETRKFWDTYQEAYQEMLQPEKNHTPWHVIAANNKKHTRVRGMEIILDTLKENFGEATIQSVDPELEQLGKTVLERY